MTFSLDILNFMMYDSNLFNCKFFCHIVDFQEGKSLQTLVVI